MKLLFIENYAYDINKKLVKINNFLTIRNKNIYYKDILDLADRVIKIGDILVIEEDIVKEPLGYLVYKGFEIISVKRKINNIYIVKIKKVKYISRKKDKKYSFLIKLPRTGKNGKKIYVYKFRTMQPYSEYIQDLVIRYNGLNNDGTIRNDFRITKLGRFLRKYWLDELPMLINWFRGDLKLIGVRPLSDTMLNQYPRDFVEIRNNHKPGLIPPYYIDSPKSFEGIIESEIKYIKAYDEKGYITDVKYFFMFLKKVIFGGVRSS